MQEQEDIRELVTDEDFQAYCAAGATVGEERWTNWAQNRPNGEASLRQARKLVDQLSLRLPAAEIDAEFKKLKQAAFRQDAEKRAYSLRLAGLRTRRWVAGIAAALLVALFSGWLLMGNVTFKAHQTAAGQTEVINLPDGSTVELNANSSLRFAEQWGPTTNREVWLHGEAFFSVADHPQTGAPQFIVHTEKGDVAVLGTKFNVNEHQDRFEVVLVEGKVAMQAQSATLKMIPGQRAWLTGTGELQLEKVDTEPYVAWKSGRLLFREMPISRVVNRLYDDFGIVLNVPDNELLQKQVSANMNSGDPYALVEAIAALYHLNLNTSTDSLELTLTD